MTTEVSLSDTLPKDAGNAKFIALIDTTTSQGDFGLLKGIGTSSIGTPARRLSHMAIGTHEQGSPIEANHPFVSLGGPYLEAIGASAGASKTSGGSGQIVAVSNWNELHTRPAYLNASQVSTSANLIQNGSGILYSFHVACSEVNLGAVFRVRDSTTDLFTIIAGSAFGNYNAQIPEGGIAFNTTLAHAQTVTGAASVTLTFR